MTTPARTKSRRGAGYSIRRLKSGRWQLRVRDPRTGDFVGAGRSFNTEKEADEAGRRVAAEQRLGQWHDPRRGERSLADYLAEWLDARKGSGQHGDRYAAEAANLSRLHIVPDLGHVLLVDLDRSMVRAWHEALVARRRAAAGHPGLVPAKAYRLLSAVLRTAAEDGLIRANPCTIDKAGVERSPERALLEPDKVQELANAMGPRWHAMVLVAGWCGLRFGELVGLQRRHVDLLHRTITVEGAIVQLPGYELVWKEPKTAAGRRVVAIPGPLVTVLDDHLEQFSEPGRDGYVFVGPKGGLPTSANFGKLWRKARAEVGVEASFHDLRHVAGTLAARTGMTTREVQQRLGHASPDAAHRYQHAAAARERELADRLAAMMPEGGLAHSWHKRSEAPPGIGV